MAFSIIKKKETFTFVFPFFFTLFVLFVFKHTQIFVLLVLLDTRRMNEETIVVCNEKWLNEGYNNKDKKKTSGKLTSSTLLKL